MRRAEAQGGHERVEQGEREEVRAATTTSSMLELRLGDAGAHGCSRRDAARDRLEQVVGVVGARPLRRKSRKGVSVLRDDNDDVEGGRDAPSGA